MKNNLTDLNDHLFEALERVNNEDLKGAELTEELNRARAVANIAREIVQNARIVLAAATVALETQGTNVKLPAFVEPKKLLKAIDAPAK